MPLAAVENSAGAGSPHGGLAARQAVQDALAQLDSEHRAVVVLHELEGYKYREIAAILECPVGTVRSRLHYAMRRLRALLEVELR